MEWYEIVTGILVILVPILTILVRKWIKNSESNVVQSGADTVKKGLRLVRLWQKAKADGKITPDEWQEIKCLAGELGQEGIEFLEEVEEIMREAKRTKV